MRWLALLAAGVIYAAAVSPWASQRVPRFVLPAMAAIGAVLITAALVRSLVRLARARGGSSRRDLVAGVVNAAATLILVVSPASRLVGTMVGTRGAPPPTLAGFGDWRGSEGYPRLSAHRGVDIAARPAATFSPPPTVASSSRATTATPAG